MQSKTKPTIGIIGGSGRMGSFFYRVFEAEGIPVIIAGRKTPLTPKQLCRRADIVIISVPTRVAPKVIEETIPLLKTGTLLIDFSSVKEKTMAVIQKRNNDALGIHPLFGPNVPTLMGQTIIFCPTGRNRWTSYLQDFFEQNGVSVIRISAREHDELMTFVQDVIHFYNIAIGLSLGRQIKMIRRGISTPVFRMQLEVLKRVFLSPASLYEDLEFENERFLKELQVLKKDIYDLAHAIQTKNAKKFENIFKAAKKVEAIEPSLMNYHRVVFPSSSQRSPKSVAYLGPEMTYSHLAASHAFPVSKKMVSSETIRDVFEFVTKRTAAFGVVPAENMLEGSVQETIDCLIDSSVDVIGSVTLPIQHALLSYGRNKNAIREVRSHPQALRQCRQWLHENLPGVPLIPTSSTTEAIGQTTSQHVGFIASLQAAWKYKINPLAKNIGDHHDNQTKFYIIAALGAKPLNRFPKRAILLLGAHDRVGVLRDILNVFASNRISLTKIESHPSRRKMGDYLFFIEIDIQGKREILKKSLSMLQEYCYLIRLLGKM